MGTIATITQAAAIVFFISHMVDDAWQFYRTSHYHCRVRCSGCWPDML